MDSVKDELNGKNEIKALQKLQAAAGLIDKPQAERLDWMYEQSAVQQKSTDDQLMNMPVAAQSDKDVADVHSLKAGTAGSLFLGSATKTTEDMLRKLREDPLFQIRREEHAARESMMANPLIAARLKKQAEKKAKKDAKKMKKEAKKEKKAEKKRLKKNKDKKKKASSSSSSEDDDCDDNDRDNAHAFVGGRARSQSSHINIGHQPLPSGSCTDDANLGPSSGIVRKREEYAASLEQRKQAALTSRGAPRRMDEDTKRRRLEQMREDAARHERSKDQRIASAEQKEKEQADLELKMRQTSDQKYFRDMREQVYTESGASMADRLRTQRHRRQKDIVDPLEKED